MRSVYLRVWSVCVGDSNKLPLSELSPKDTVDAGQSSKVTASEQGQLQLTTFNVN